MTTRDFATVSVRVLGVAAIMVGVVFAGTSGLMRLLGGASATGTSTSDLHLHDTYYVISRFEDAWLAPGAVSAVAGVLLLVISRSLGAWLARGTGTES
jgi:hypothetical protein